MKVFFKPHCILVKILYTLLVSIVIDVCHPNICKAENDNEYDTGSNITIDTYTPQTIVNLEFLCKIWGFLKYYHPAVAAGDYDWDAELFRVMPSIISAQNLDECDKIFMEWIDRLGKLKTRKKPKAITASIRLQPDFEWIENKNLDKVLSQKLKDIKETSRTDRHYYISLRSGVMNPNFKNEKTYERMNYVDDSGMRLLALFRYWNMIQYFYPYKYLTDKNWNSILVELIPQFIDGHTELDYKKMLLQLVTCLNDSHAYIGTNRSLNEWKGWKKARYDIVFIEGKVVITDIWDNDTVQPAELKKGDIITHINGKVVEEIINERKLYTPASNTPGQLSTIAGELLRTNADKISLQIIREGILQTCKVTCSSNRFPPLGIKTSHKLLSADVGYIWPETLKSDSIPIIMEKFKNTKGIIIDFRCYPRTDFTVFTLGEWLIPRPTEFVRLSHGCIEQPGTFIFKEPYKVGKNNKQCYKGKVVIIVNEQTMSSAEYHVMAFQTAPHATIIGSTTAGTDGDVSRIVLPGNVLTQISGIGVYYPDGRETQRVGIAIDEEVKPTIRGIIDGEDELLERAKQIIYDR